jgi:hypothetical protein
MPHSEAYERFQRSKSIGYEQWHDGIGYDLDAFAAMTPQERDDEARLARSTPRPDWRDLELLGSHGSNDSIARLRDLLTHPSIDTRAHALGVLIDGDHTPGSVADVQLAHVLDAVVDDDDGLTQALLIAQDHAGPLSKLALLRGAQQRPEVALHFASALLDLSGLGGEGGDAAFDPKLRPLMLRLLPDNDSADQAAAFRAVCGLLGIDSRTIPEPGSGRDITWAERTWPRKP